MSLRQISVYSEEQVRMKFCQSIRELTCVRSVKNQNGFILIAALTLLAALILVGTTTFLVSSTDVKIGGNFKTSQIALQVAMAGTEHARQTLRASNSASTTKTDFSEELAARVGANGVLNGYTSSTDDSPIASSSTLVVGYAYNAYLTNDSTDGASSTTDSNAKVLITSVATGPNNAKAIVITTVQLYSFSGTSPATIYSKDNLTVSGSSITISGSDGSSCGGAPLAPIYTRDPATTTQNGSPTLSGSPPTPQQGTLDIDLDSYVNTLSGGATYNLTADASNETYGSSTNFVTVYADAIATQADGEIKLNNVTGYGILLIKGDLELAGNITWNGLIIVTGKIKTTGGGKDAKNIYGQIYAGQNDIGDSAVSGSVTVSFHSCNVTNALASQPLKVVNWKQSF
jgi:Tfp pilus assembly protein PilX